MIIHHFQQSKSGFTLIEIVLVMGIIAVLFSYTTINLLRPQISANLDSTTTQITTEIKTQQLKSMTGDTENTSDSQSYGIRFEADRYILLGPSNFTVDLEPSLSITNAPQEFTFAKRSGETTAGSITLTHSQTGTQKTISLNSLGRITIN